jgi:hypothetical protein
VTLYCERHGVLLEVGPGARRITLRPGVQVATDCALLHHPDPQPGKLPCPDRWGRPTDTCCEVVET